MNRILTRIIENCVFYQPCSRLVLRDADLIFQRYFSRHETLYNAQITDSPSKPHKNLRQELEKLLGISPIDALKLVSTQRVFNRTPQSLIAKNVEILLSYGINKEKILKCPITLCDEKLKTKLDLLKCLPINLDISLPLLRLNVKQLHYMVNDIEIMERIKGICDIFKITTENVCEIFGKKSFLINKPINEIEKHMTFLHDYGFDTADILKDLWTLKYSESCIKSRLDFVRNHTDVPLKTWMIRCPEETLDRHIKREMDNKHILGENSVAEYLSQKLNCSLSIAKYMIGKHPQLQNKSLLQMNVMIDLLYKYGVSSDQICKVPKVILHSFKTTEQRLKQLHIIGKPDSLYLLTKSKKQYLQCIDSLIKAKKQNKC